MTTVTAFTPGPNAPFSFQATLDGQIYTVTVTWSLAGQRWYVNCSDLSGNVIFLLPLIGSPDGLLLSSLSWANNEAAAVTSAPHGYQVGSVINLTVSGATPIAYNGLNECLITGPSSFSYDLANYPGPTSAAGSAFYNINLAGGYFQTSTLIFRDNAQVFEVAP